MKPLASIVSDHRAVLRNFISRDLKVKYTGTVFGYLWTLLEPLSLVAIYYFLFEVIALRSRAIPNYPLLVFVGVLAFNYIGAVISGCSLAMVANAPLIRRVPLPREVYILSTLGSQTVIYLASLIAVIPFLVIYRVVPGPRILLFPIALMLMALFAGGIGWLVACANVVYRDVAYVVRVVLRLLFYGAPVVYPVEMVPENLLGIYLLNPLAVYLTMVRSAFMNKPFDLPQPYVISAIVAAFVMFFGGRWVFSRWEKKAVKFL